MRLLLSLVVLGGCVRPVTYGAVDGVRPHITQAVYAESGPTDAGPGSLVVRASTEAGDLCRRLSDEVAAWGRPPVGALAPAGGRWEVEATVESGEFVVDVFYEDARVGAIEYLVTDAELRIWARDDDALVADFDVQVADVDADEVGWLYVGAVARPCAALREARFTLP